MKVTFHSLFILSATFLFISCGSQKTGTKLEINTAALATSNSTYEGGLVIMGKSSAGSFVLPIDFSGTSSASATLELKQGTWTFSAIAWAGSGTAPKMFQGNTYCVVADNVTLNQSSQTVNLKVTAAGCTNRPDVFGPVTNFATTSFNPLRVVTCGWLQTASATPITASTSRTYCASTEALYQKFARSIKVEVPKFIDGVESAGISTCHAMNSTGVSMVRDISFPAIGLGFKVSLYRSSNCLEDSFVSRYNFLNGIQGAQPTGQDSFYNTQGSTMNLFLPMNELKKGYTSLFDSLPRVTCNGMDCVNVPSSVPGSAVAVQSGREFRIRKFAGKLSCADISSVTTTGSFTPGPPTLASIRSNCEKTDEGHLTTRIDFTALSTASLTITTSDGVTTTTPLYANNSLRTFEAGWETFGYPVNAALPAELEDSFKVFFEDDGMKNRGILSRVTGMFSPDGPAGVLGQGSCSSNRESTISFSENGKNKTYRIKLVNAPTDGSARVSSNIADGTYPSASDYSRRMLIQKMVNSTPLFETELVIDFHCGQKIGRLEAKEVKEDRDERVILEWNTRVDGNQKVFEVSLESESDTSGIVSYRSGKQSLQQSGTSTAKSTKFEVEVKKNGANWDFDSRKVTLYSDTTNDRITMHDNSYFQSAFSSDMNDAGFASTVSSNIATPFSTCIGFSAPNLVTLADSPCTAVLGSGSSWYSSASTTWSDYVFSNFSLNFTANLENLN